MSSSEDRTTVDVPTSIECIVRWVFYMVKWHAMSLVFSHEVQSEKTAEWIRNTYKVTFNPDTLSRAWRHARGQGRVVVEEVESKGPETCWKVLEIDGKKWADVRKSEARQETLDFPY